MPPAAELSYVLPLRWRDSAGLEELACYLEELSPLVAEVLVVDGSERELFERHGRRLARLCRDMAPDPVHRFAMGKVDGVTTGVIAARCAGVVVADDDVRWDAESLERAGAMLDEGDWSAPRTTSIRCPGMHASTARAAS